MIKRRLSKTLRALDNKSRENRMLKLASFLPDKTAAGDQHGVFQNFQSNVTEYATRERYLSMRGNMDGSSRDNLYGVGPEHEDSYVPTEYVAPSLSTRYSPDRVGVQARRVSDGVYKDPYTNKIYDYNEGFTAESGESYPGGSPALQSSLMYLANHLDRQGLVKEANYVDGLLKSAASWTDAWKQYKKERSEHQEGKAVARATQAELTRVLKFFSEEERADMLLLMSQGGGIPTGEAAESGQGFDAEKEVDIEGMRISGSLDENINVLLKIAASLDAKGDHKAVKIVEDMISAIEDRDDR